MNDRDILALVVIGEILAGDRALRVVASADAEDIVPALLRGVVGQGRVGRGRGDLQHPGLVIDRRGRYRRRRAVMPIDEHGPLADHVVRRRDRLFRIARVVGDFEGELLAENAALRVDVLDRHAGAARHLLADRRVRPGDRPDDRDLDVLRPGAVPTGRRQPQGQAPPRRQRIETRATLKTSRIGPETVPGCPARENSSMPRNPARTRVGSAGAVRLSGAPAERPVRFVEPGILPHHLAGAGMEERDRHDEPEHRRRGQQPARTNRAAPRTARNAGIGRRAASSSVSGAICQAGFQLRASARPVAAAARPNRMTVIPRNGIGSVPRISLDAHPPSMAAPQWPPSR